MHSGPSRRGLVTLAETAGGVGWSPTVRVCRSSSVWTEHRSEIPGVGGSNPSGGTRAGGGRTRMEKGNTVSPSGSNPHPSVTWFRSSVGQSWGLLTPESLVRVQPESPWVDGDAGGSHRSPKPAATDHCPREFESLSARLSARGGMAYTSRLERDARRAWGFESLRADDGPTADQVTHALKVRSASLAQWLVRLFRNQVMRVRFLRGALFPRWCKWQHAGL